MQGTWIPGALTGCSAGLAMASIAVRSDRRVSERLGALVGVAADSDRSATLLSALGRSGPAGRLRPDRSAAALDGAGIGSMTPDGIAGMRLLILVAGVGLAMALMMLWPPAGVVLLCAIPAALRLPAMLLRQQVAASRLAIDHHVLELTELLLAVIEAGLPPATAVERAAGFLPGPLGAEVDRVGREIALGLDWRAALDQSASRTQSESLAALASALGRAHRLGTSPRVPLRALATELRAEHRARAEERARRAPVQMLFPLVLLILPAFLLLTVGPVLLATVRSLH